MKKILIVEDDAFLLAVYIDAFKNAGYEVVSAENGEMAVLEAVNSLPDFILLDIMLPKKDGIAALRALKANNQTLNIPVAMLTALPQDTFTPEDSALLGTAIGYWLKDQITPQRLVDLVGQHLYSAQ